MPEEASPLQVAELIRVYGQPGCAEILTLFPEEMRGLLDQAGLMVKNEQSKELSRIAHQMKGLSAFVICPRMETLSRQLETTAEQSEWKDAHQTCTLLEEWFTEVKVFIDQFLPSISSDAQI